MGGSTWLAIVKEDRDNKRNANQTPDMNTGGAPSFDTKDRTEKNPAPDPSNYRLLLDFFSKDQFVDELRTMNARMAELQQWHEEWEEKQKTLEDEREKYRLLEGAISDVVLLLDASLRVIYCTSSIESFTGHKKEEVTYRRLEKLLTPPSLKAFMERLAEELVTTSPDSETSSDGTFELELYSKKNGSVTGNARMIIRRGSDQEPAEFMVIVQSLRDKKRSEKLLWDMREQYRILFREMQEPAYFVTSEGEFLDVNRAWLDWLGYSREEIVGVDIREVFSFPTKHPLYHHRAEGRETREFRGKLKKKSGVDRDCVVSATAWRGQGGELLGYFGIVHRPAEEARSAGAEGAREGSRDILLAAVAHEIKKPLGVVIQGLDQIRKQVHDPLSLEAIERAGQAAMRASNVINSVLDLYRGSPPTTEQTDLAAVNNEILFSYDEEIRARNISVITDFAPDLPSVRADAGRLGQVVTNIITNAMAAMPRSGVITIKATKKTGEDGRGYVSLIYADTGLGMEEDELRKAFDPFFTTKGRSGGLGLGLTLSKEIIEHWGGSIKIESRAGQGTTVTILLPCG